VVGDAGVGDAGVGDAGVGDAGEPEAALTPPKSRGRRGLVIALVFALVAVLGLGALSAYLWSVHSQYVAQNEELRETAQDLGDQVGTERAKIDEIQAHLDATNLQLGKAKDTINGLANSEAQAGDDRQALIDVADGLQECAKARQELINYLKQSYKWTTSSLRAIEASTTKYCNEVAKNFKEIVDD